MTAEVLPYVPDAWVDHDKTKIGYEIPLTRHFYKYVPPRPLGEIDAEIKAGGRDSEVCWPRSQDEPASIACSSLLRQGANEMAGEVSFSSSMSKGSGYSGSLRAANIRDVSGYPLRSGGCFS